MAYVDVEDMDIQIKKMHGNKQIDCMKIKLNMQYLNKWFMSKQTQCPQILFGYFVKERQRGD